MRLSDTKFKGRTEEAAQWLQEMLQQEKIDPAKLEVAFTAFGESDPLAYTFDDEGAAIQAAMTRCMTDAGLRFDEAEKVLDILKAMQDPFKDIIGTIAYAVAIPGPSVPPDDQTPDVYPATDGRTVELWYLDADSLDDAIEDPDSADGQETRFVNPFVIEVVVGGVVKTVTAPAWVGYAILATLATAILGGNTTDFFEALKKGFRRIGRGLKKVGKKIKKALGF